MPNQDEILSLIAAHERTHGTGLRSALVPFHPSNWLMIARGLKRAAEAAGPEYVEYAAAVSAFCVAAEATPVRPAAPPDVDTAFAAYQAALETQRNAAASGQLRSLGWRALDRPLGAGPATPLPNRSRVAPHQAVPAAKGGMTAALARDWDSLPLPPGPPAPSVESTKTPPPTPADDHREKAVVVLQTLGWRWDARREYWVDISPPKPLPIDRPLGFRMLLGPGARAFGPDDPVRALVYCAIKLESQRSRAAAHLDGGTFECDSALARAVLVE